MARRAAAVLVAGALVGLGGAAGADPQLDVWYRYPSGQQVTSIVEVAASASGYVSVADPLSGAAHVDIFYPDAEPLPGRVHDFRLPPTFAPLGLEYIVDRNGAKFLFATVGQLGVPALPSPLAGVRRLWLDRDGATVTNEEQILTGVSHPERGVLIRPWGAAFRWPFRAGEEPALYVTDAEAGAIWRIANADTNTVLMDFSSFTDDRYRPDPLAVSDPDPTKDVFKRTTELAGITGIAVCPYGGTYLCSEAGNLVVANTSTARIYEVPVHPDGTLGAPRQRLITGGRPVGLAFGPSPNPADPRPGLWATRSDYVETGLTAWDADGTPWFVLRRQCALSGPVDVAPVRTALGPAVFVANRNAPPVTQNPNPACQVSAITRVLVQAPGTLGIG